MYSSMFDLWWDVLNLWVFARVTWNQRLIDCARLSILWAGYRK